METPEATAPGQEGAPQTTSATAYEFDAEQSKLIGGLAAVMRDVGLALTVFGIALVIFGILLLIPNLHREPGTSAALMVLQGVVLWFIGAWTRSAGNYFRRVTATTGSDIAHLMDALRQLQRLYSLQRILILVALIPFVVTMVGMVMAGVMGSGASR